MALKDFQINGKPIGNSEKCYIIAELSANHHHDFNQACELIKKAKECGADAVKLQTYTANTLTLDVRNDYFTVKGDSPWKGKTLFELYKEAMTPWEWQPELKKIANSIGLDLFSSPFDRSSVDFLEKMDVPAYKIASFEIVDLPLVKYVAQTKKPMIISTGMSSLDEIQECLDVAYTHGATEIALLKCTSAYPASIDSMNLSAIKTLKKVFNIPVGLSDHSMEMIAPLVSYGLGARIIEKHFTLSRDHPGPDSHFSLEPQEFKVMVEGLRNAEKTLGNSRLEAIHQEDSSKIFRKSIFVAADVVQGDLITDENIRVVRPGFGLHPRHYESLLGRKFAKSLKKGEPLSLKDVEDHES